MADKNVVPSLGLYARINPIQVVIKNKWFETKLKLHSGRVQRFLSTERSIRSPLNFCIQPIVHLQQMQPSSATVTPSYRL